MKLGKIMIFVSDLAEAKQFYCDVLGFELKGENESRLEFVHEGCDFIAFKCETNTSVGNYSQEARSVFVFEVASVDQALHELKAKGVRFLHQTPAENDFSRYAAFIDPFGNVHEVYETKTLSRTRLHPNIWIEAEQWAEGEWDAHDCNSDVIVSFEGSAKRVATFFTYENIKTLTQRHLDNGDCLNGKYFWATDMILVDELSRERIEEVVTQLLVDNEFERVFSSY